MASKTIKNLASTQGDGEQPVLLTDAFLKEDDAGNPEWVSADNMQMVLAETQTATNAYAVADFDRGVLYIVADPGLGAMTLTFPAPVSFTAVGVTEMRHIAIVMGMTAENDITIACADDTKLLSQPGTDSWDATESPVKLGRTLALQHGATASIWVDGVQGLLVVQGAVRA